MAGAKHEPVTPPMLLLVLNAGSSSLKASLVEGGVLLRTEELAPESGEGLRSTLSQLFQWTPAVDAVAHRIVHGGAEFTSAVRLDPATESKLDALRDLAPLHNPRALEIVDLCRELRPELPQFACFDTTFHATMPPEAATYALPRRWSERWGLRRYGFHGLSHAWASRRCAELVGRPIEELRIVSAHIGSGASLAAVAAGRSVDTTMGFTPLEGLVMATRAGTVDPGLLLYLLRRAGLGAAEVEEALEHQSGLRGMAGTADLREVIARADRGDPAARLAYGVYIHRLRAEIGAMAAAMDGLEAVVFTGGAGAGSARLRADTGAAMGYLGVELDPAANQGWAEDALVSRAGARAAVAVVVAREDLEIARQVDLLTAAGRLPAGTARR